MPQRHSAAPDVSADHAAYNVEIKQEIFARYRSMQYGVNRGGGHHDTYAGIAGIAQYYRRKTVNSAPALS